jgi:hypothetical protein
MEMFMVRQTGVTKLLGVLPCMNTIITLGHNVLNTVRREMTLMGYGPMGNDRQDRSFCHFLRRTATKLPPTPVRLVKGAK